VGDGGDPVPSRDDAGDATVVPEATVDGSEVTRDSTTAPDAPGAPDTLSPYDTAPDGLDVGFLDAAVDPDAVAAGGAACDAWAAAYCDRLKTCRAHVFATTFTDLSNCRARESLVCNATILAYGTGASAKTVNACVAAIATTGCAVVYQRPPPECVPPKGAFPDGSRCTAHASCASGFCDGIANDGTAGCGTCMSPSPHSCSGGTGTCGVEYYCQDRAFAQCVRFVALGEDCSADARSCVTNAQCDATTKRCVPASAKLGDPCDFLGPMCADDLQCDFTTHTCQPVPVHAAGEPCTYAYTDSGRTCVAGTTCRLTSVDASGPTCLATSADGAACGPGLPECTFPAACRGDRCVLPDRNACL